MEKLWLLIFTTNANSLIKCADWVLDLGSDGGKNGGTLVVEGTPETVAACTESYTGQFLATLVVRPLEVGV